MSTINVHFYDVNDNLVTFVAEEGETFNNILHHEDVQDWFDNSDADPEVDIESCITTINGADVSGNDSVIDIMLRATAQDGDEISFDFEADNEENEAFDDAINREGAASAAGASGVVIVSISGGLQTARINIVNGTTTLREVIFNDTVRARSGMNDAQLAAATIQYHGTCYSGSALDNVRVNDADIVDLAPRVAATKG